MIIFKYKLLSHNIDAHVSLIIKIYLEHVLKKLKKNDICHITLILAITTP